MLQIQAIGTPRCKFNVTDTGNFLLRLLREVRPDIKDPPRDIKRSLRHPPAARPRADDDDDDDDGVK